MTNDDLDLAGRARDGDTDAFRQLLEGHYECAYRVAVRMTGSVPDAEDITQDVFVSLPMKLGSFRGDSRFSTWLYSVVVNACRDHHRLQTALARMQEDYASNRDSILADEIDSDRRRAWLSEALLDLEPALRETAVLVLSEDLNHREAAAVLGCAESTVSWRMHEVRRKLSRMLEVVND